MTIERRNDITEMVFRVLAQRAARYGGSPKTNPVAYGSMVLSLQSFAPDVTIEEIDHVLVQLHCRLVLNLIAGELFYSGLIKPEEPLDNDTIDWVYGSGRYAQ